MSDNGKIKVTKKTPHSMYGNVFKTYRQEEIIKTDLQADPATET